MYIFMLLRIKDKEDLFLFIGTGHPLWLDWASVGVSEGHPGQKLDRLERIHTAVHDLWRDKELVPWEEPWDGAEEKPQEDDGFRVQEEAHVPL